jgi:hypothetical protein
VNTPCIAPEITSKPADDQLSGSHCGGDLSFQFTADPGMEGDTPATIEEWNIVSGIGTLDNSGYYEVAPQPSGTYPVTIEVTNHCLNTDTYSFDVVFTNAEPFFSNCPYYDWFVVPVGYSFSYPIYVEDADNCDDLAVVIDTIEYYGDTPFLGTVSLEGDMLIINTTEEDDSIQIRVELHLEDGVGGADTCELGYDINGFNCGDVDHLVPVDVDDVVFLVKYVFLSGFPPEPYHLGDVNCSGAVDIDDVVHLVGYVFGGGYMPCDTDGDGIPDC